MTSDLFFSLEMVFFLAGGDGAPGVNNDTSIVALDGIVPGCSNVTDLPERRKGAASMVDQLGNVLLCGGVGVSGKHLSFS